MPLSGTTKDEKGLRQFVLMMSESAFFDLIVTDPCGIFKWVVSHPVGQFFCSRIWGPTSHHDTQAAPVLVPVLQPVPLYLAVVNTIWHYIVVMAVGTVGNSG